MKMRSFKEVTLIIFSPTCFPSQHPNTESPWWPKIGKRRNTEPQIKSYEEPSGRWQSERLLDFDDINNLSEQNDGAKADNSQMEQIFNALTGAGIEVLEDEDSKKKLPSDELEIDDSLRCRLSSNQ